MTAWHDGPMLALDFESTGIDATEVRAVQVALARITPGQGAESHVWLINPGVPIPEEAAAIHGITDAHAFKHGKDPRAVLTEVRTAVVDWLQQCLPIVAFNASYDCMLLECELERHGLPTITDTLGSFAPVIDPYVLDKHCSYRKGSRKLIDQAEHYGVRLDGAHDAGEDALAAARDAGGGVTPAERLTLARAEIARRRQVAEAAAQYSPRWKTDHSPTAPQGACCADGEGVFTSDGAWLATVWEDTLEGRPGHVSMSDHIAENDPTHVLAVLAAAEETLLRHAPRTEFVWCRIGCSRPWPCPDVLAVLDLYAPLGAEVGA